MHILMSFRLGVFQRNSYSLRQDNTKAEWLYVHYIFFFSWLRIQVDGVRVAREREREREKGESETERRDREMREWE